MIQEGKATLDVKTEEVISKDLEVFYNPAMKLNRDISVAVLNEYFKDKERPLKIALPLAGSGVRAIRIALEGPTNSELFVNDRSPYAIARIEKHAEINKVSLTLTRQDANLFLRTCPIVDYIDIDPYGSSIPFVESALQKLHNGGILALTNTDTAALCGSYPKVTRRRYNAKPFNRRIRQELGIRILIKKAQEIAAVHDIGLIPILSYTHEHYMRVFFKAQKGKVICDELFAQHAFATADELRLLDLTETADIGPFWNGSLGDTEFVKALKVEHKIIEQVKEELEFGVQHFFDLHEISKCAKQSVPRFDTLIEVIKAAGYKAMRTSFSESAIKTDMPKEDVLKLIIKKKD
jgi:tRNA (guanine26-N2/guanine27-N2)-dimethyltransferase